MPFGKYDHFKAFFGTYDASKLADWRAYADAALAELKAAVDGLEALAHDDHGTHSDKYDQHVVARGVAHGKEGSAAAEACKKYKAVADAASTSLKAVLNLLIASPPDTMQLDKLLALDDGAATLDRLIAQIGTKANSQEKRDLVVRAMKKRFKITSITGELTSKAMPRMYALLVRLPDSHTVNNPKLDDIQRNKARGESSYNRGRREIVINATTAGMRGREVAYQTGTGDQKVKAFDAMMLHEVGHSVDHNDGIMPAKAPAAASTWGAWREESQDSVVAVADAQLGFANDFPGLDEAMRKRILEPCLQGGAPTGSKLSAVLGRLASLGYDTIALDPGLEYVHAERVDRKGRELPTNFFKREGFERSTLEDKDVIKALIEAVLESLCTDEPAPTPREAVETVLKPVVEADGVDWAALGRHPAVTWLVQMGQSTIGNWREKEAVLRRRAVDPGGGLRVYQQSYPGRFWSYLHDARQHIVRNYQFRAEGEWFAEVYALYFMGLMGPGHATYSWLNGLFGPPPAKMS